MTMATQDQVSLKRTPLYDRHVKLGGKMVDFGGFELPIQYTSIMEEPRWVRSACGVFDVSHLGEVKVTGTGAFPYLQKMVPTDLVSLGNGRIQYTVLLNEQGGVMDDILIYRVDPNVFYLVINASGIPKICKHLRAHASANVTLANQSDDVACVAIQGPKSAAVCEKGIAKGVSKMKYYSFAPLAKWGKSAWISRTGYTGEDGFEVFSDNATVLKVWDKLVGNGKKSDVRPIGLGARNTLRLEAGNGLYGTDLDETKTPYEARLSWLVSDTKPDFVGRKMLFERKKAGFRHKLCGFKIKGDRAVPREGYPILRNGRKAGIVTSGSFSPTLKTGIGLGYVETVLSNVGAAIDVEIHGRPVAAEVVKLPFVPLKHK